MFRRRAERAPAVDDPAYARETGSGNRAVEREGGVRTAAVDRDDAASGGGWRDRRVRRRGRAAGAVGDGVVLLGRAVRVVAGLLALVIALGIAFIALDANSTNSIVSTVHDAARSLVGPFDGMFTIKSHKVAIAVNWGVALVVYLVVGSIVAGLIERLGAGARGRAVD